jgi:hypothetical protein
MMLLGFSSLAFRSDRNLLNTLGKLLFRAAVMVGFWSKGAGIVNLSINRFEWNRILICALKKLLSRKN